jgi:putative endonuclease
MWFVYIILTKKNKLYTGITTDPQRRFKEHLSQKKGAKYFRQDPPKEIVFQEEHPDRSSALKRESEIKKMTRKQKESLLN